MMTKLGRNFWLLEVFLDFRIADKGLQTCTCLPIYRTAQLSLRLLVQWPDYLASHPSSGMNQLWDPGPQFPHL